MAQSIKHPTLGFGSCHDLSVKPKLGLSSVNTESIELHTLALFYWDKPRTHDLIHLVFSQAEQDWTWQFLLLILLIFSPLIYRHNLSALVAGTSFMVYVAFLPMLV